MIAVLNAAAASGSSHGLLALTAASEGARQSDKGDKGVSL